MFYLAPPYPAKVDIDVVGHDPLEVVHSSRLAAARHRKQSQFGARGGEGAHHADLLKVFPRDGDDPASSSGEVLRNLLVDLVRLRRLDHEDFHRLHSKGSLSIKELAHSLEICTYTTS